MDDLTWIIYPEQCDESGIKKSSHRPGNLITEAAICFLKLKFSVSTYREFFVKSIRMWWGEFKAMKDKKNKAFRQYKKTRNHKRRTNNENNENNSNNNNIHVTFFNYVRILRF